MTFNSWISFFVNVELPVGDLARDISNDQSFPVLSHEETDLTTGLEYLQSRGASYAAVKTFENAWKHYEAEQNY